MRRLLGFAFVALALTITGVNAFAATKQHTKQVAVASTEVKGEIIRVKGHTLTLKDEAGKEHLVRAAETKMFEGLKVGDRVDVKLENGKAISVEKI